ncbi:MAG: DUF4203 domain-containing protein [Eubacteriales bacterium]|nr:DUF4203 domain-containing protein [Eubacteriales bacterium]
MIEILARIMNIAERVRNMEELPLAAMGIFGILLVFGILNCVLGYRLLRFWMMLFGFVLGAGIGLAGAYTMGVDSHYIYLAVMLILGVLLAVVAFLSYKAGIFIIGMGIGLVLSIYLLHPTTSSVFFVCILIGVGLGTLAMRYAREVIIVGTSLLGGVLAGISLARIGSLEEIPYGVGMSIGFALLGMLIQFATNKTKVVEEPKKVRRPRQQSNSIFEEVDSVDSEEDQEDYDDYEALEGYEDYRIYDEYEDDYEYANRDNMKEPRSTKKRRALKGQDESRRRRSSGEREVSQNGTSARRRRTPEEAVDFDKTIIYERKRKEGNKNG